MVKNIKQKDMQRYVKIRILRDDKSPLHLPQQEVAFSKKSRKIKGFVSLREDFIPKLSQKIKDLGL